MKNYRYLPTLFFGLITLTILLPIAVLFAFAAAIHQFGFSLITDIEDIQNQIRQVWKQS